MVRPTLFVLVVAVLLAVMLVGGCPAKKPVAAPVAPPGPSAGNTPAPVAPDSAAGSAPAAGTAPATAAGAPAETEGAAPAAAGELTKDQVKRFMGAMKDPGIKAAMDKLGKEAGLAGKSDKQFDAAKVVKVFDEAAKSAELDKAVQARGFKDAAEYIATAKVVIPGLSHAMGVALAAATGGKAGAPPPRGGEFDELEKAFGKPTAEQQKVIDDAIGEVVKEQMAKHKAK